MAHNYPGITFPPNHIKTADGIEYKFTLSGAGREAYCKDLITQRIGENKADFFIILLDSFMTYPWLLDSNFLNAKSIFYFPSDGGGGMPRDCERILQKVNMPVAMAKFGQKQVKDYYNIDCEHIPHGVNINSFKYMSPEEKEQFKAIKGLGGKFVIGIVARNQGRKMLDRAIKSFSIFAKDHQDAVLLMHSVSNDSPVIIRKNGIIETYLISELVNWKGRMEYEAIIPDEEIEIWGNNKFTKIKAVSRHLYKGQLIRHLTKEGIVDTTPNHSLLDADLREINAVDTKEGDLLKTVFYPNLPQDFDIDEEYAWALGLFLAEGTCNKYLDKTKNYYYWQWKIDMENEEALIRAKKAFEKIFCIPFMIRKYDLPRLICMNENIIAPLFHEWFYTRKNEKKKNKRYKKVPPFIFRCKNSSKSAFFEGYYAGDGSQNKYRMFTTDSKILATGLMMLLKNFSKYELTSYSEERNNEKSYYKVSLSKEKILKDDVIKKKVYLHYNEQYVYDIHTEDNNFHTGIGNILVHNTDPYDLAAVFDMNRLIARYGLQNRVLFTGVRFFNPFNYSQLNEVYALMDVFLLPTSGEGFGIPIIEAMACGIPQVVTDYTTTPQLLMENGQCGEPVKLIGGKERFHELYEKGENLKDVDNRISSGCIMGNWDVERAIMDDYDCVDKLHKLYIDRELRRKYGKIGREKAEKYYSWNVVLPQWDKLLERMSKI